MPFDEFSEVLNQFGTIESMPCVVIVGCFHWELTLGPAINWGWHGRAWSSCRFATARGRKACPSTLDRCRLAERASLVRLGLVPSASDASALASGTFFRVAAWLILSDGVLGRHVGGSSVGPVIQTRGRSLFSGSSSSLIDDKRPRFPIYTADKIGFNTTRKSTTTT